MVNRNRKEKKKIFFFSFFTQLEMKTIKVLDMKDFPLNKHMTKTQMLLQTTWYSLSVNMYMPQVISVHHKTPKDRTWIHFLIFARLCLSTIQKRIKERRRRRGRKKKIYLQKCIHASFLSFYFQWSFNDEMPNFF